MTIRQATLTDSSQLSKIISSLAHFYFPQDTQNKKEDTNSTVLPNWLTNSMTEPAFTQRLQSPNYQHWVYEVHDSMVGYISLKLSDDEQVAHLYHLFVLESHHRQGIANALWQHTLNQTHARKLTLRSSLYAVPVYERFGFTKTGNVQYKDGLSFQPMLLNLNKR